MIFRESYELSQKNYFTIQWLLSLDQRSVHFNRRKSTINNMTRIPRDLNKSQSGGRQAEGSWGLALSSVFLRQANIAS